MWGCCCCWRRRRVGTGGAIGAGQGDGSEDHRHSLEDLAEVAALCEKALEKGLGKEDEAIARQLLTGALYQRASTDVPAASCSAPRADTRQ